MGGNDRASIASAADDLLGRLPILGQGHALDEILRLKLEAVRKLADILERARGSDKIGFVRTVLLEQLDEVDTYVVKAGSPDAFVEALSLMRKEAEMAGAPAEDIAPKP